MSESDSTVPYGYCHCGCGVKAPIAEYTPMSEFDFGWLVGILEGEGSFTSTTRTRKRTGSVTRTAQIIVSSTDKSTIERLSRLAPFGMTFHRDARPPRREVWTWSLKRADVVTDLMIAIRPYMSPRRRERIDELLATCNTRSVA